MPSIPEEYIQSVMLKVNSVINLTDFKYKEQKFENIGQNYFGVILPVTVIGTNKGKEQTVELVLKLAPTDERYRVSGAVTLMFAREIYVYSIIFEKYRDIQLDFPIDLQLVIPKCFYISKDYCKEAIVLQNMCADGYTAYMKTFLDFDHIMISLKALATFHALSFIVKERESTLYQEAEKICVPLNVKTNKRFMEVLLDRIQKAIEKNDNTKYVTLLNDFKVNCVKYVEAAAFSVQKLCICHGDIWKENILFKYENEKPVSACIIDYQTARISSPAFDVLYLITSSTDSNLRRRHYKELLSIYRDQFSRTLQNADLSSDKVYSKAMFDDDLKTVAPACFIIANTALWLHNGLQEEGHVRSKKVLSTPEEKKAAVDKYKHLIQDIIDDYIDNGYLVLPQR